MRTSKPSGGATVRVIDERPARAQNGKPPQARTPQEQPVRERLVSVATRLFAEHGFESTSVQEIVEAAGVTKGAMYHYYGSKDDLLYEVYHRLLTMQTARLVAIADGDGTAQERLRRAAADVVETSLDNLDDMNVFFRSMHMLPPDQRAKVRSERRGYHDKFRALVDEGMEAGTFRSDIPADVHVQYFLSGVNQMGTWFKPGGSLTAARVSESFTDLLLAGLRP
jgi:AcrR family transcriptional regulator